MADAQTVKRRAIGLFTHPNILELPPGALVEASNAVIDREYVIQKRRGFKRYGSALVAPALGMMEYKKRLIVLDGDKLKYDSDGVGTWLEWDGHFQTPDLALRLKGLETNGNVYFPTLKGTWKNDTLTGIPVRAGMPRGLDLQLEFTGDGDPAWHRPDSKVGYRVIWGREDANKNLITGTPSWREEIVNPAPREAAAARAGTTVTVTLADHGFAVNDTVQISEPSDPDLVDGTDPSFFVVTTVVGDDFTYETVSTGVIAGATLKVGMFQNVTLEFTVPDGIQVGDFYEIYRTIMSSEASVDSGERFFRVIKKEYTGGTTITYLDETDEEDLDLPLYTNDTEEGPTQTNDRPGYAKFIAFYKTHTFYGYCRREQFLEFTLESLAGVTNGSDTITITAGTPLTYTFAAAENVAAREFRHFTQSDPETPTEVQTREQTMKSFCRVVNRTPTSRVYAVYTSGADERSGKVMLVEKNVDADFFTVVSTVGTKFSPDISSAVESDAELGEHFLCRSKSGAPEHVPFLNRHLVGRKNKAILGLSANRDSLFIYKEDGVFVLSGETDGGGGFSFTVTEFDPTVLLASSNTIVTLDNSSYSITTQGGMRITQSSSSIFSRQIENEMLRQVKLGRFAEDSFALNYESERKYLLFFQDRIYCYNYLTNAWTIWLFDASFGHVLAPETIDRLYIAHGTDAYVLEERKTGSFGGDDYQDEDLIVTVTAKSTTTFNGETVSKIRVVSTLVEPIVAGWGFSTIIDGVETFQAIVEIVTEISTGVLDLTLSKLISGSSILVSSTVTRPIPLRVVWAPESAGSAGTMKQYSRFQVYQENNDAVHNRIAFMADHQDGFEYIDDILLTKTRGWGLGPWGSFPWGDPKQHRSTPLATTIPQDHQRARTLTTLYENKIAREQVSIVEAAWDVRAYSSRTERTPT